MLRKTSLAIAMISIVMVGCNSSASNTDAVVKVEEHKPAVAVSQAPAQTPQYGITPVGREAKYPVFPLPSEDLDDLNYKVGSEMWDPNSIMQAIPPIENSDVNKNGYTCEFLCVNSKHQVVGWNPVYGRVGK